MKKLTHEDIENFITTIDKINNPLLVANKISYFISDALRENTINLFEAYLLNLEEIKIRRIGYIQLSWNVNIQIRTCLAIINQLILAYYFGNIETIEMLKRWGLEAFNLNKEKRSHYIMDEYELFLNIKNSDNLLRELLKVRNNYNHLNDDLGPYHIEVFPYHFYSPEKILLEKEKSYDCNLGEQIENLIIYLNLKEF
ncbi:MULTISPECIES: hypothetical protein [unclassified Flavobacterium]|jgi:hypothetical protein|uniref:hypothetical protein n=1 Tax=unclassified Flavobacterium TaxID=196869 RepID=UPI00070EEE0B|nr:MULTISPECIES: hypothetical protein [unclassified Flavobacterium]KRD61913.1 hypothetical protein ASE40_10365 [Flavobacterium sp. Root935]MDQ1167164.1 hypothetical protein [Flavobacterium sp. SORGH_AS_0622]BDU27619.1 hypothetical protein FLGSB24_43630 [Flavobacterium sp. GSB-24]